MPDTPNLDALLECAKAHIDAGEAIHSDVLHLCTMAGDHFEALVKHLVRSIRICDYCGGSGRVDTTEITSTEPHEVSCIDCEEARQLLAAMEAEAGDE